VKKGVYGVNLFLAFRHARIPSKGGLVPHSLFCEAVAEHNANEHRPLQIFQGTHIIMRPRQSNMRPRSTVMTRIGTTRNLLLGSHRQNVIFDITVVGRVFSGAQKLRTADTSPCRWNDLSASASESCFRSARRPSVIAISHRQNDGGRPVQFSNGDGLGLELR
jgi:hypothetical protein